MHNILQEIINKKKIDLSIQKNAKQISLFRSLFKHQKMIFIGEIKLSSPTEKLLGTKEEIIARAISYEQAGIDAISFITEKHYFNGDISFIPKIKENVSLPILQKDFIIDEFQIYEAKSFGADALLLIARLLDAQTLIDFVLLCQKLSIEPVIEINSKEDLQKAIATNTKIIAVNARDLDTFTVSVTNACKLLKKIPDIFIKLAFSGVKTGTEVKKYKEAGALGILVGTELMKAENIGKFVSSLRA